MAGMQPLASGQACFGIAFPPSLMKQTAATRSPLPRLWEKGILREGENECWVQEAIVLHITTPYTSDPSENEYQEHFLGVKAAGA